MSFMRKRQSQDSILREYIMSNFIEDKLLMSNYSYKQFAQFQNAVADDNYVKNASRGDICFVEDKEISLNNVSRIILCNWNRHYPADRFFNIDLVKNGFYKTSEDTLKGSSHDKITIETYVRSIS